MTMTTMMALAVFTLSVPGTQDRDRKETISKLHSIRITLDFQDAPLESVVDYVREISDMNFFVDSKVRELDINISLKVSDISLRSVFRLMLDGIENRCTLARTVGSNPTRSASFSNIDDVV